MAGYTLFDLPTESHHSGVLFNVNEATLGKDSLVNLFEFLDEHLAQALAVCLVAGLAIHHARSMVQCWSFPEWHVMKLQLISVFVLYALLPCIVNPENGMFEERHSLKVQLAEAGMAFLEGLGLLLLLVAIPRRIVFLRTAIGVGATEQEEEEAETEMGSSILPLLGTGQADELAGAHRGIWYKNRLDARAQEVRTTQESAAPRPPSAGKAHDRVVAGVGGLAALVLLLVRPLLEGTTGGYGVRFIVLTVGVALSLVAGVEARRPEHSGYLLKYSKAAHYVCTAIFSRAIFRTACLWRLGPGVPNPAGVVTNVMAFAACFFVAVCVNPMEDEVVIACLEGKVCADLADKTANASRRQAVADFHAAAARGDHAACSRALETDPSLLEERDEENRTAFDLARLKGHIRVRAILWAAKARAHASKIRSDKAAYDARHAAVAAFFAAVKDGDASACGSALQADLTLLEARDKERRTAFDLARQGGHLGVRAVLWAASALAMARKLPAVVSVACGVLGPRTALCELFQPPMSIAGPRERNRSTSASAEKAAMLDVSWTHIHPVWPGAVPDKRQVVAPGGKLPAEREKAGGSRNTWPGVFVDLYTSRLRNMDVTIILVSVVLVGRAVSNVAKVGDIQSPLYFSWVPLDSEQCRDVLRVDGCLINFSEELSSQWLDSSAALLSFLADILAGFFVWLVVAAALAGNNAFVGTSPTGRMWVGALAVLLMAVTINEMNLFLGRLNPVMVLGSTEANEGGGNKVNDTLLLTMDFLYVCLLVAGFFTCVSALLTREKHNAFHRSEMEALWYTTSSLQPPANVESLRLEAPKEGDVLLLSPQEVGAEASFVVDGGPGEEMKVVVTKNNDNGTCDVARADGRPYRTVLYKYLRREGGDDGTQAADLRKKLREKALNLPPMFLIGMFCCLPILFVLVNLMFEAVNNQLAMLYKVHAVASFGRWADETTVAGSFADTWNKTAQAELAAELLEWRKAGGAGRANRPLWFRYYWDKKKAYECGSEDHEPAYKFAAILQPYTGLVDQAMQALSTPDYAAVVQQLLEQANLYDVPPEVAQLVVLLSQDFAEQMVEGRSVPMSRLDLGYLICEAKLLVRFHGFTETVRALVLPSVKLHDLHLKNETVSKLHDETNKLLDETVSKLHDEANKLLDEDTQKQLQDDTIAKAQSYIEAIVKDASAQLQDYVKGSVFAPAVFVVQRLEAAALAIVRSPNLNGAQAAQEIIFPGRTLDVIMQMGRGECVDLTLLLSAVDLDGDGALGLQDEAPSLIDMVMGACQHVLGTCPAGTELQLWKALYAADKHPKDDRITAEEIQQVAEKVQTLLQAMQRAASGMCDAGGAAGLLSGALQEALDANGDKSISLQEAADAANALQAVDLSSTMKAFFDSDTDGDGHLTVEELKGGSLGRTLLQLCPSVAADGDSATRALSACNYEEASKSSRRQLEPDGRVQNSSRRLESNVVLSKVKSFMDNFKILGEKWVAWILVGVSVGFTISLFVAALFTVYCVAVRYPGTFKTLSSQMQAGDKSYPGATHWKDMKSGFSESALFPGILAGTLICSFVTFTIIVFVVIVVVVLLCLPMVGLPIILQNRYIIYAILARVVFKWIFTNVVLEIFLASNGEIVQPRLFAAAYFVQLFISFPLGVGLAFFRVFTQMISFFFSASLLDVTVLPEEGIPYDSGYYSFLCVTYTSWMRQNPLRKGMITSLMGKHTHRVYGVPDEERSPQQQRRQRVRNRFNVAVTLFRNPEIRKYRRRYGLKPEAGGPTPDLQAAQKFDNRSCWWG